jgi:hypothetical protein
VAGCCESSPPDSCQGSCASRQGPVYNCPTCITPTSFKAFTREAVTLNKLTAEPAPRESVGGRAVVLTCAECNHNSGSRLDVHASKAVSLEEDPPGTLRNHPVRASINGVAVNMVMNADTSGIEHRRPFISSQTPTCSPNAVPRRTRMR